MDKVLFFIFAFGLVTSVAAQGGDVPPDGGGGGGIGFPWYPQGECDCENSYFDPSTGTCSPRCYGDNVVWGCVNPRQGCSDSCADRVKPSAECKKKSLCYGMSCICKTGYGRDRNYNCVPIDDCKKQVVCPKNEFYSTCKSQCFTDSCDRKNLCLIDETCQNYCNGEGCVCETGYARCPVTKKCVPISKCPTGCPTNEIPVKCKDNCLDETCEAYGLYGCAVRKKDCVTTKPCIAGCRCKPNYYRSPYANGECVCKSDCAPVSPPKVPVGTVPVKVPCYDPPPPDC